MHERHAAESGHRAARPPALLQLVVLLLASRYGGKFTNPGLWFCDYVGYYLDVRKSVAEVGAASHAEYEDKIRDLIYNNNMACSMAAPK